MTRSEALQSVLAGEHATVYAYGVVGARLRGTADEDRALARYGVHRTRRDAVAAALLAEGATPVAAAPAYDLGTPVTSAAGARRLAADVELGLCGPYADLVGASEPSDRRIAAEWCADGAVVAVSWGGDPVAFPGLAERS